jgi:hypothetical protein
MKVVRLSLNESVPIRRIAVRNLYTAGRNSRIIACNTSDSGRYAFGSAERGCLRNCFQGDFYLGLYFDPEYSGYIYFRNVGFNSAN